MIITICTIIGVIVILYLITFCLLHTGNDINDPKYSYLGDDKYHMQPWRDAMHDVISMDSVFPYFANRWRVEVFRIFWNDPKST